MARVQAARERFAFPAQSKFLSRPENDQSVLLKGQGNIMNITATIISGENELLQTPTFEK